MVEFEIPEAYIFAKDNAGYFWVPFFFWKKPLQRLDQPEPSPGTVDRGHVDDPRVSHHTLASISSMRFKGTPTANQDFHVA